MLAQTELKMLAQTELNFRLSLKMTVGKSHCEKATQTAGLEPARAEPSGFLVHPLNRLGTTAAAAAAENISHRSRGSMEERWTSDPTVAGSSPAAIVIFVVAKVHPRWGSNPQPPAPETDALPLRHAGLQKWVMVMLGLEPRTFALSERRSTD